MDLRLDFFDVPEVQQYLADAWEYRERFFAGYRALKWWESVIWYRFVVSKREIGIPPKLKYPLDIFFTQKYWNPKRVWVCSTCRLWIGSWELVKWKSDGKYHLLFYEDNWI